MKILTSDDLDAVLSLFGQDVHGARPLNIELAGSRRVDLLADVGTHLVHGEFQRGRSPDLALRMVEYWARIMRSEGLQPLRNPTTAALAALAWGTDEQRMQVLLQAAELISRTDPDRSRSLLDAATTLGSIVLSRSSIDTALRGADMPISIRETPLGLGLLEEGRQEGRQEGERAAVLRLTRLQLRQRLGDDPRVDALAVRLAELPDEERLRRIGEVSPDDLDG